MIRRRFGANALLAGAVCMIVTMAFHPTGHDFADPERMATVARWNIAVHALALVAIGLTFVGALSIVRWLEDEHQGDLAGAGLVAFGFASIAGMIAGILNGFVAPALLARIEAAKVGGESDSSLWRTVLTYNFQVNQACAAVLVVGISIAILTWSFACLRANASRLVGGAGIAIGAIGAIAMLSGHLRLDVHGFGAVVLLQSIWYFAIASSLRKAAVATDR